MLQFIVKRRLLLLSIVFFMTQFLSMNAQIQNPKDIPFDWRTDTTRHTVELSEIQVVLPRNSFPSIDYPKFIGKNEGMESFFEKEPVISVVLEGQAKAYPLNMLTMHEITNDTLAGRPILPTYCPLCNASVVYDRRLNYDGKDYLLEFEVSGMLRNSDMVMADQETHSWWQQFTGEAIVGELAGAELTVIPSQVISVEDFFLRFPEGQILSPETQTDAMERYGTNPYVNYDERNGSPYERFFDTSKIDKRLEPMERVLDIPTKKGYKVYPFSIIAEKGVINDELEDDGVVIFYKKGTVSVLDEKEIAASRDIGSATAFYDTVKDQSLDFRKLGEHFVDQQTGSIWDITGGCIDGPMKGQQLRPIPHSNHFAFAFLRFHPDAEIYE